MSNTSFSEVIFSEALGHFTPNSAANSSMAFLASAKWDADEVRDDLREYVVEHLGDEETGVLIVDETGFLKKGEKSVGVARQYTGTAGDTVNCQVGVFLAYSSEKGAAFLDRALYLPRAWTSDPATQGGGRRPRGAPLPQQDRAGRGDAGAGLRGRRARPVGGGGLLLRTLSRLQSVAGGAGTTLRGDGAEDQRRSLGRTQEEDRALRRAAARRRVLRGASRPGWRRQGARGSGLAWSLPRTRRRA